MVCGMSFYITLYLRALLLRMLLWRSLRGRLLRVRGRLAVRCRMVRDLGCLRFCLRIVEFHATV